eukprot:6211289-Pleurochrysis_carterae.AAC.2
MALDTRIGGRDHDLARTEVTEEVLRWVRERRFDAVFAAPPCESFSVAHAPQLRSRAAPAGIAPAPRRWRRYLQKHSDLAGFAADVMRAAHAAG